MLLFFANFIGSILVGIVISLLIAVIVKAINSDDGKNIETIATIFGPWLSYLIAEAMYLSGIVSILFSGMILARYAYPNLS